MSIRPGIIGWDWRMRSFLSIIVTGVSDMISLVETEGSDLFYQLLSQEYQTWYHWLRLKDQIFSINYCHRSFRPDIIVWDWRIRYFLSIIVTGVSPDIIGWDWRIRSFPSIIVTGVSDLISLVETEGSDLFYQLLSQEYQTWYHWLRLKDQIFSINYCHRSIRPDIIGWDWRIRSFLSIIVTGVSPDIIGWDWRIRSFPSIIVTGVSDLISLVETERSDLFYQLLSQEYQTWYHWLRLKD